MEQAKQRYQRILELAKKFNNFNNQFNRIENSMPPESLIKLKNLENLNFSTTQKGKEQWQILDLNAEELFLTVKKFDTHFQVRVFNKGVHDFSKTKVSDVVNNYKLDENCIALIEVTNIKKGVSYFFEIVVAKTEKGVFLVEKTWTKLPQNETWSIDSEVLKLTDEEIETLFGDVAVNNA